MGTYLVIPCTIRLWFHRESEIVTKVGPEYKVPNHSESLTWSSSGLMRTIGPVRITNNPISYDD